MFILSTKFSRICIWSRCQILALLNHFLYEDDKLPNMSDQGTYFISLIRFEHLMLMIH